MTSKALNRLKLEVYEKNIMISTSNPNKVALKNLKGELELVLFGGSSFFKSFGKGKFMATTTNNSIPTQTKIPSSKSLAICSAD